MIGSPATSNARDPGLRLAHAPRIAVEAGKQPALNLSLARVYLRHSDLMVSVRIWQHVLRSRLTNRPAPGIGS